MNTQERGESPSLLVIHNRRGGHDVRCPSDQREMTMGGLVMIAVSGSNPGLEFLIAVGFVVGLVVALLGKR